MTEKHDDSKRTVRLFVDMDGTLTEWKNVDYFEQLLEKDFFRCAKPNPAVVAAIKSIMEKEDRIEVFVLGAYLPESEYALAEKNEWLDVNLPQVDAKHRLFCPCGKDKAMFVPGGVRDDDVLLDDYSLNLIKWARFGRGLKLMNGVNGTKGTWCGARIEMDWPSEVLADGIIGFACSVLANDQ